MNTIEPRKTPPDMMPGIALLGGFGAGIALLYFLDPEQGKRRRALLRDEFTKWTRVIRETSEGRAKDLRNRTIGAMHEARKAVAYVAGLPTDGARYPTPGAHEAGSDDVDAFLKSLETGTAQRASVEGKASDVT